MYIERITESSDVKKLNINQLNVLADEIRSSIIDRCSKVGGHLGSNLGIVELIISLHYVFDIPKDKIVYDVSHQVFTHKILTGRNKAFTDDSRFSEVVEFCCPSESETDLFHIGHTSTSIGLACGMAFARNNLGGTENIIAVIGDAALGGGQAFEGLNISAGLNGQFLIVLNDNEMSVFDNHGKLYDHLSCLRVDNGNTAGNIFEELGFKYKYLDDGNDIEKVICGLEEVKAYNTPTVIHIHTKKGKGYKYAEVDKARWHYSKPFNIETGEVLSGLRVPDENYGNITYELLTKHMTKDPGVMVVTASTPSCIGFPPIRVKGREFENQFIDVGIEEQNALLVAAGISKRGGKVVFGTWATFYQRAYDQIAHEICLNNLPITMLVTNASINGDPNDTHSGLNDIAMFSSIPGLLYLAPAYKEEYIDAINWSISTQMCPVAIRIPWNGVISSRRNETEDWSIPSYRIERKGNTVAILALGGFYDLGCRLCDYLEKEHNIHSTLINPRFANRTDETVLDELTDSHRIIVTIEDASVVGGFGAMISQYYSDSEVLVKNFGFYKDLPSEFDSRIFIVENGLTSEKMAEEIISIMKKE
ncbi:MAG: 1-deoxy-D-xylulose-5-phosphate synthase [Lachnospiraceae bacterium]|nr:1-deoxy-D-xylulose-5-phosphate synthase [Lachnospiraceae bacterium]